MNSRYRRGKEDGLTLVELILAILLLGVLVLAGMSMELSARRVLMNTDYEGALSTEAGAVVTMVTKNVNRAIGTSVSPFITVNPGGNQVTYTIQQDSNGNGIWEPGGDVTTGFRHYTAGAPVNARYHIYYMRNNVEIISLTNKCVAFSMVPDMATGSVTVSVTLRRDPFNAVNLSNPEATLVTYAQARAASLN